MISPNGISRLPDKAMLLKNSLLCLNQAICCGYSKVFQSYKHMFTPIDKKKIAILGIKIRTSGHMINLLSKLTWIYCWRQSRDLTVLELRVM